MVGVLNMSELRDLKHQPASGTTTNKLRDTLEHQPTSGNTLSLHFASSLRLMDVL